MLAVRLLGKFDVSRDGKPIAITSRPAQSLFAYLILNPGTAHRREKLAGMLWPDSSEQNARNNLRNALWRIRKTLPARVSADYILANDLTVAFNPSAEYWLDVGLLGRLDEDATTDELIAALSEGHGELLPGFYDEWVTFEREHLYSIFEHHMARLMSLLENGNRWLDILDWGERWIKFGKKPEPAYRALMTAHAAKGDISKVAATYERCVRSLQELGVEPSAQTRALYEKLKAGKEIFEPVSVVPAKENRKEPPNTNLPVPLTTFIGRDKELEEIARLLGHHRLVTLTGPGGVGKTRLAIQSSNGLLGRLEDGVWWVELAPLTDGARMPHAVAEALGLRELPGQPLMELLKSFLREKRLLLVLDNCEHLTIASAQFAFDLLSQCANLRILTTSREALGITGEVLYPVPTLSFPKLKNPTLIDLLLEYESIRLFVERASAVNSDFALSDRNAGAVIRICERLDGISLALELAAARIKLLSAEQIAERLNDRFQLLTQGSHAALPRHQTLRAAIDWSHNLLTQLEQVLFRRLAIFRGGFTLEAVEAVVVGGDVSRSRVADLLGQLINKSLITARASPDDLESGTRYGMLETIREYAHEKLEESGEKERLRQHHRDYFIALAERAEPKLKGDEQIAWLDRLEVEHDNWRAAWDSAIESDADLALRLVSALLGFWLMRGNPSEGRGWLAELIERHGPWGQTAQHARALNVAGRLAHFQDDLREARSLLEQSLSIARISGDQRERAFALLWLGRTAVRQRDGRSAKPLIEEGLEIYQELQDEWGIAMAWQRLAEMAGQEQDQGKSKVFFMKALSRYRALGDRFGAGSVLNALGEIARFENDYENAGTFYEQAVEILLELGSRFPTANPLFGLAWVSLHQGDYQEARRFFEESLKLYREYGYKLGMLEESLGGFASILGMTGKPELAAQLFGAVESLLDGIGQPGRMELQDQKEYDHYIEVVRGQIEPSAFARAWARGRSMTLEQAIEFALAEQLSNG